MIQFGSQYRIKAQPLDEQGLPVPDPRRGIPREIHALGETIGNSLAERTSKRLEGSIGWTFNPDGFGVSADRYTIPDVYTAWATTYRNELICQDKYDAQVEEKLAVLVPALQAKYPDYVLSYEKLPGSSIETRRDMDRAEEAVKNGFTVKGLLMDIFSHAELGLQSLGKAIQWLGLSKDEVRMIVEEQLQQRPPVSLDQESLTNSLTPQEDPLES
jgi:hypothetical protein